MNRFNLKVTALVVLTGLFALGVVAHNHGSGQAYHSPSTGGDAMSISGSPTQLAERAQAVGNHLCEVLALGKGCPVMPAATSAAAELQALQVDYELGMQKLHAALLSERHDPQAINQLSSEQSQRVQIASTRYLKFLADGSASMSAEQKASFNTAVAHGR